MTHQYKIDPITEKTPTKSAEIRNINERRQTSKMIMNIDNLDIWKMTIKIPTMQILSLIMGPLSYTWLVLGGGDGSTLHAIIYEQPLSG